MELAPLQPTGRQVIERYAAGGFRVSGVVWPGPILVFPEATIAWELATPADRTEPDFTEASFAPVVERGDVQILLLGMGRRMAAVAPALRVALRRAGIALEAMDTGAACRTYNLLLAEERRVAAALLPPA
ncbi:MAG: Mth938-like domain-containing protein [Alphaproteobacteria bacterium]|nr:Mth938-like domain-containing protein [Alphaproteobacteria bacterium]